jgi:hypothetical protein
MTTPGLRHEQTFTRPGVIAAMPRRERTGAEALLTAPPAIWPPILAMGIVVAAAALELVWDLRSPGPLIVVVLVWIVLWHRVRRLRM